MTVTQDWSDLSLVGLFRLEVETQAAVINNHLIALESRDQIDAQGIDALMRAAHSIKGAARIVQVEAVVKIAHALEDFFMVAKQGTLQVGSVHVDVLLAASDFMLRLSSLEDAVLVEQSSAYENETNAIVIAVEELVSVALRETSEQETSEQETSEDALHLPFGESLGKQATIRDRNEQIETVKSERIDSQSTEKRNADPRLTPLYSDVVESKLPEFASPDQVAFDPIASDDALSSVNSSPSINPLPAETQKAERTVRINADNLNRLMGLAGESVVESNWWQPFMTSLLQLKQQQQQVMSKLETLRQEENRQQQLRARQIRQTDCDDALITTASTRSLLLNETATQMQDCQQLLNTQLSELDGVAQRFSQLSDRLYREMIASHMCAFESGTKGYSRLVRDLAKQLGKRVELKIEGLSTQVDRTLLEKLDAPIVHLITNAIAHGIEAPENRCAAGKPERGTLRIEAVHHAGMLRIVVEDDGSGFDFAALRQKIVTKGMTPAAVVDQLSESELIEFLFLPGFSTHSAVDQYSGRGYGLDVARSMVQSVGGSLLASSTPGEGTRFQFQLPLTLSVVRSLIFEVAGEPYALNLARIDRIVRLSPSQIRYSENRPYFSLADHQSEVQPPATGTTTVTETGTATEQVENVSLVSASQLLAVSAPIELMSAHGHSMRAQRMDDQAIWVIVLGEPGSRYGLCVEQLRGEQDLVVRPLDSRLGKVPNISSAALSEKGEPILILDVADVLCSAASLAERAQAVINPVPNVEDTIGSKAEGSMQQAKNTTFNQPLFNQALFNQAVEPKKVLVVDDSMTVRAMEKKVLQNRGYAVDMAVDGADGWNALQMNTYDLLITDIDMPRLSGIELIERVRSHVPTKRLPVIVVSYKDREADQLAGLDAGANYYLTKSSFHNDGLINAVVDLIGVSGATPDRGLDQGLSQGLDQGLDRRLGQGSDALMTGHSS